MRSLALCCALALAAPITLTRSAPAEAAVAVRASLDQLVGASVYVVVGRVAEHHGAWEDLAGARRIVTYTKIIVEQPVVGAPPAEVWVRTLGGVVGSIGQYVPGEARLRAGERALLFLREAPGTLAVTALGQGHFTVATTPDDPTPRLQLSERPELVIGKDTKAPGAGDVLVGASLSDAIATIQRTRRSLDAQP